MNIEIIISLLIALVVICATTIVNNIINKGYITLRNKWEKRTRVMLRITYNVSKIDNLITEIKLVNPNIDSMTLQNLIDAKDRLTEITNNIESYEYENF